VVKVEDSAGNVVASASTTITLIASGARWLPAPD